MAEDVSKKVRKPYVISKSRESWTEMEHDRFLEALHLFDRDWKKIETFVGSKTVIQFRSHAQKYFLKVQKNGMSEHVPPPRPKRKAAHPYPHKASKIAHIDSQLVESPIPLVQPGYALPSSNSMPTCSTQLSSWTQSTRRHVSYFQWGAILGEPGCCGSNESSSRTLCAGVDNELGNTSMPIRVTPDFAQVYNSLGSVFDPNTSGHSQRLKNMDPINIEMALLLMRNLAINLTSPELEDHVSTISWLDRASYCA